ncbi:dienelactone hydrolase family protein [Planctellipticum variicoloris]|uniref:dienelactone hydrolase family protein n=1 Tax=Planctellipticum variicoloris TaxID=3064265 RepID=UPI0030134BC6|nr:dienelactone hydrolase family protein [Planctomycetaceae bacterium SH412]
MATADFRDRLLKCLGGDWPAPVPLNVRLRETLQREGVRIESLFYDVFPGDSIPALLLIPAGVDAARPAPAIAVWHQHNGEWHLGKSEPAGLAGNPMHHTGLALARQGYVVLCPDALCFEERQDSRLKGGEFERFEFLRYTLAGQCMAWRNILDMKRSIDFLASRPEVRADQIGCYGHSMGSTHTWLAGPWEPRIKCLVGNCCLPTYKGIHREKLLHCFPNFIPGLQAFGDTPDIAALIAPRPLLLNFGELDRGSPIEDVREALPNIQRAYDSMHAGDKFSAFIEAGAGHVLSEGMWERTLQWFGRHLPIPA